MSRQPRSRSGYARNDGSRRCRFEALESRQYLSVAQPTIDDASGESLFSPQAVDQFITVDGQSGGRLFDGLGGVSASSSRLLYDYPEPQRSDILDFLFKPNYGAGLQILKVEIGGDVNSTAGAEASHMRTPTDLNFTRGYEWWLMKEARTRNPDITLAALQWGAPGWFEGGFWSEDNIEYIVAWLDGAAQHGLSIDYVGGWNESGFDADWFVALDQALAATHPEVKIIAADDLPHHNWRVADAMASNPAFRDAVDVLGQHSPGGWRTEYEHYSSTPQARSLGKPLWTSEQSAMSHDVGGAAWARGINRAYIDARITASINWAPVSAWYANFPLADTGQILAEWPWSGYYQLGSTVWAYAHTTQFAEPGWQYLDASSGYLASGASYVTLKSPSSSAGGGDFSTIIETLDATGPSTVQFTIAGGLASGPVQVWTSDFATDSLADDFIQLPSLAPADGVFTMTLEPGRLYSLTTTTGQHKGDAQPPSSVYAQMPLPFLEDFESYAPGRLARFFSDVNGGFETVPAGGGRAGMAYRQMVSQQPIRWNLAGAGSMPPTTVLGDPRWWGDYEVRADVLLEQSGYVELVGRVSAQIGQRRAGYHLQVHTDGTWRLYSQDLSNLQSTDATIATGSVSFAVGQWHNVALAMRGEQLAVIINGEVVGNAFDARHTTGNVGLRVSGWQNAQFDNVDVTKTRPAPYFVPQGAMTATATSEHNIFYRGDVYRTDYAIDGRPESVWHTRFNPRVPLPASLTFDLGSAREVKGLTYQPRIDNETNGMITRYHVYLSDDGVNYRRVVDSGEWPVSSATKLARWSPQIARFVRLEAVEGRGGDLATAGEVNIIATAPPVSADFDVDGDVDGADFLSWQRNLGAAAPIGTSDRGDADGDLDVDGADLAHWRSQFAVGPATANQSSQSSAEAPVAADQAFGRRFGLELSASDVDAVMASFQRETATLLREGLATAPSAHSVVDAVEVRRAPWRAPTPADAAFAAPSIAWRQLMSAHAWALNLQGADRDSLDKPIAPLEDAFDEPV